MSPKEIDFGWAKVQMVGDSTDPYFANLTDFLNGSPGLWYYAGNHLAPGAVIFDCGANIGATALMMATRCPKGHVYAFEASPKNAGFLRQNIELNHIQNVTVVEQAIGDVEKDVAFHLSYFGAGSHIISPDGSQQNSEQITLRTTTLDTFAKGFKRLDFIKMDVEGYEPAALLGAKNVIAKLLPKIYVEINTFSIASSHRVDPIAFINFLWNNFDVYSVEFGGELKPLLDSEHFLYDNMINNQCVDDILLSPCEAFSFTDLADIVHRAEPTRALDTARARIRELEKDLARPIISRMFGLGRRNAHG